MFDWPSHKRRFPDPLITGLQIVSYPHHAKGRTVRHGPVKFFGEGCYRRTAAWRDSAAEEIQAFDCTAVIEAKRKKRASE